MSVWMVIVSALLTGTLVLLIAAKVILARKLRDIDGCGGVVRQKDENDKIIGSF